MINKAFKQKTLILAMGLSSIGLVACGGNDDYQAKSCIGTAGDNPDDCRHFKGTHSNQQTNQQSNKPTKEPTAQSPQNSQPPKTDANLPNHNSVSTANTAQKNPDVKAPTAESPAVWQNFVANAEDMIALQANPAISINKNHHDEHFHDLAISDKVAIVASHYHNRLRQYQLNSGVATFQQGLNFATVSGDRYQVDAVSGATEQTLADISIESASSGLIVVGEVQAYADGKQTGVGLYATHEHSGSLKPITFASQQAAEFIALKDISAQALTADGKTIAIANKDGQLMVLDAKTLQPTKQTTLQMSVSALAFSQDGKQLYVAGKQKQGLFSSEGVLLNLDAQQLQQKAIIKPNHTTDFDKVLSVGSDVLIAKPTASNQVLMLQWQADGLAVQQQRYISMPSGITHVALTTRNQKAYLAISDSKNQLNVINLHSGKRAGLTYSDKINGLAFDNQGFVWILSSNRLASIAYPEF